MHRSIDDELYELKGIFPLININDFKKLPNGNTCVEVSYYTKGKYSMGRFDLLIEYPPNYPNIGPFAWIQNPSIRRDCKHVHNWDSYGDAKICYHLPREWRYSYTSYDVAMMIQTWIYAYCVWNTTGNWDWIEAGVIDHIFPR